MKKIITVLTILTVLAVTRTSNADDYYRINISRVSTDIYKIHNIYPTIFIKTRFCFEFVYNEEVTLMLTGFSGGYSIGRLYFDNRSDYDVEKLFRGN